MVRRRPRTHGRAAADLLRELTLPPPRVALGRGGQCELLLQRLELLLPPLRLSQLRLERVEQVALALRVLARLRIARGLHARRALRRLRPLCLHAPETRLELQAL